MTTREIIAAGSNGSGRREVSYFLCKLSSLAIECKRMNELNDEEELEALANVIKEVYFQDYKTAYNDTSSKSTEEIDQSHFEHLI